MSTPYARWYLLKRKAARIAKRNPVVPQAKLKIATTNQRTADLIRTVTTSNNRIQQRTMHYLGGQGYDFRVAVTPRIMTTTGEGSMTTDFVVDAISLEVDGIGSYPAYFGGQRTRTVTAIEVLVLSDIINIPQAVLDNLNRDTKLWVRGQFTATNLRFPVNTAYLIGTSAAWTGNASYFYPTGTAQTTTVTGQIDTIGALEQPVGNSTSGVNNNMRTGQGSNTGHTIPVYILCKFKDAVTSVMAVGDSNTAGVGDPDVGPVYDSNGSLGGRGFPSRVATSNNTADPKVIPMLNTGLSAMLASSWTNDSLFRIEMLKYVDVIFEAMGNNDISQAPSLTSEDLMVRRRAIWKSAKDAGCKVIALGLPPRTVSSSNNTPYSASWGPGGAAQLNNVQLAQEKANKLIDDYLLIRQFNADTTDDTIWRATASTYVRTDGTHMKSGSTIPIAAALRSMLISMFNIPT